MHEWPTLTTERLTLTKRHPLAISRGSTVGSRNLFVSLTLGEHTGIGELAPATGSPYTAERGEAQLIAVHPILTEDGAPNPHEVWDRLRAAEVDPPAIAAYDVALWDLLAKRAGMPLHELLGLPRRGVPTSVTVGIASPEEVRERAAEFLARTGARALKIKLGSPDGIEADRAIYAAAQEAAAPYDASLRVDANGGWTPDEAIEMSAWLEARGCAYVEQPLAEGHEDDLPRAFARRKLPIFLDESCRFAADVPGIADRCDGVNLKLMKCGGITEALRLVATARAHGLATMVGCMSDTSIGIAAAASLGALFDFADLDSHLNLAEDPADGAPIQAGIVLPAERPGHGGRLLGSGNGSPEPV